MEEFDVTVQGNIEMTNAEKYRCLGDCVSVSVGEFEDKHG